MAVVRLRQRQLLQKRGMPAPVAQTLRRSRRRGHQSKNLCSRKKRRNALGNALTTAPGHKPMMENSYSHRMIIVPKLVRAVLVDHRSHGTDKDLEIHTQAPFASVLAVKLHALGVAGTRTARNLP